MLYIFSRLRAISTLRFVSNKQSKSAKMAELKELTYQDVAEHNTKKDLYIVVHDKIYDTTKFIDEHP